MTYSATTFIYLISIICVGFIYCYIPEDHIESRIISGSTASKSDFPYQASIRTQYNQHICGGAVIGSNWILTSAECVYKKHGSTLLIVVGNYQRESRGENYNVSNAIWHSNYNPSSKSNNIGLLKTSKPVKLGKYVKTINLAYTLLPNNTKCEFTGWGSKKYPSSVLANKLRYIKQSIVSTDQCKRALPQYFITNSSVCAFAKRGQGACTADEGGPLMCKSLLYGVLSQYVPCAQGYPDVYTSVVSYRRWIKSFTGI